MQLQREVLMKVSRKRGTLLSAAVHAICLLTIVSGIHWGPKIAPDRLPGTEKGLRTLTYFSPGHAQPKSDATKDVPKKPTVATEHPLQAPVPTNPEPARTDLGTADSAKAGLGQGDVSIALQKVFPYPKPDLSTLPHHSGGDVILNAVIDEHGKIKELTIIHGLGDSIDQTVIATVQQWSYTPATKDGVPVPSEQELHFHYERS